MFRFCDTSENKEVYDVVRSSVFNVLKSAAKCKTDALAEKVISHHNEGNFYRAWF